MSRDRPRPPKRPDGSYDKEAIQAMFMASPFLDWQRFAEEQGWDALLVKRELPVRTWIKEKRDIMTEKQMDILSGLIHERKFKWTNEIIKTLDEYPPAIDMALNLAKAKMSQIGHLYQEYLEWRKDPANTHYKNKRRLHPFEKMSMTDMSMMMKGMKDITEAKLKALMLDKWAVTKLDLPVQEDDAGETGAAHRVTIEGKGEITYEDMQRWFDAYVDKPTQPPLEINAPSNEGEKISPPEDTDGGS